MDKITLRKFPCPYQAALAICSDIDGTSLENFIAIHKFLNTNQETTMGQGLGLSIGDSFWMYDRPGLVDSAFSYFENLTGKESDAAPIIHDFVQAGIIDVMHSYGNFATMADFSRRLAVQAIETLQKHNMKIKVWTNHGGIESIQKIGAGSWGKGDIPTHEGNGTGEDLDWYHTDLLIDYGVRFYWDSEVSVTSLVGQDAPVQFSEAFWRSPLYSGFKLKLKSIIKGYFSFFDLLHYKFTNKHIVPWQPFDFQNQLIQLDELRDGNPILKFIRFGHRKLDWSDDLNFILNDKVLAHLVKKQGYLILYIRLSNQKMKNTAIPLPPLTIQKLQQIAEWHHTGNVWIQTTSRLLLYNWIQKHLKWTVKESENNYQIQIEGLDSAIPEFDLSLDDLRGLTFIAPSNKEVTLFFHDRLVPCTRHFDKRADQQFAMVPLSKIEWPL